MLTVSWDWARHGNACRGRANLALTWKCSSSSIANSAPKKSCHTQVEELPLFPCADNLKENKLNIRAGSMSVFLPRKHSHSLNKLHKKEWQKRLKPQKPPEISPHFAIQAAAQEDTVNKEQTANDSKKIISNAQRGYWGCLSSGGRITQHALLSAAWLRKGSWKRERSIAE